MKKLLSITLAAFLLSPATPGLAAAPADLVHKEGKKLQTETAYFQELINSGDIYLMNESYGGFSSQIEKTEAAIGKVSGKSTRTSLLTQYIKEAKVTKERMIYELSAYRLIRSIGIGQTKGDSGASDIKKLDRLLSRAQTIKDSGNYAPLPPAITNYLAAMKSSLANRKFVKYDSGKSGEISSQEFDVFMITNFERSKNGSSLFTLNMKLSGVSKKKSKDMYTNRYFNHISPVYGSPFDMMKRFGITYRAAGENIASGYTNPHDTVTGWMNSPGHRENILKKEFGQLGTGCYSAYWTQMFTN